MSNYYHRANVRNDFLSFVLYDNYYRRTLNISDILVGKKNIHHADVVGASPADSIFILDFPLSFNGLDNLGYLCYGIGN